MNHMNKEKRLALAAMISVAAVSLLVVVQGYIGLGFLLFAAAATPLPLLAWIRARWPLDASHELQDRDEGRSGAR